MNLSLNLGIVLFSLLLIFTSCEAGQSVDEIKTKAEQGDIKAQNNLGALYAQGKGVPQNYAEAIKWFKKSADQGHAAAQYNLGVMYVNGEGVPQDYIKAYSYLSVAAALNDQLAKEGLSSIQEIMTPEQVAEGQKQGEILLNKIPQ